MKYEPSVYIHNQTNEHNEIYSLLITMKALFVTEKARPMFLVFLYTRTSYKRHEVKSIYYRLQTNKPGNDKCTKKLLPQRAGTDK